MCSPFVEKWYEFVKTFLKVDYVREKTAKKSCKCGKCGSLEHEFFLL